MTEQVVQERIRGFLCLASHPAGCAANVKEQIKLAKQEGPGEGLGNVLVIGSSTGYGLASLITAVFGYGAKALGVCYEKNGSAKRAGTAGYYNVAAVHRFAKEAGKQVETRNGDAFSHEMRAEVIDILKQRYGKLDQIVYSLAAPKRKDPDTGEVWSSCLKTRDGEFTSKSIDLDTGAVTEATIGPATDEEVAGCIKVMGGEDWKLWIDALREADLLAEGCRTVAYSYIGPELTDPIYRGGTIGAAKDHLEATARAMDGELQAAVGGHAWVSVNKALVTQASAAIPVVPLYISLLFKAMKERGTHEGTMEQILRLYRDHFGPGQQPALDDQQRIRIDDLELAPDTQAAVAEAWQQVNSENLAELGDFEGFKQDFRRLFGFGVDGVDYDQPVEVEVEWA